MASASTLRKDIAAIVEPMEKLLHLVNTHEKTAARHARQIARLEAAADRTAPAGSALPRRHVRRP